MRKVIIGKNSAGKTEQLSKLIKEKGFKDKRIEIKNENSLKNLDLSKAASDLMNFINELFFIENIGLPIISWLK